MSPERVLGWLLACLWAAIIAGVVVIIAGATADAGKRVKGDRWHRHVVQQQTTWTNPYCIRDDRYPEMCEGRQVTTTFSREWRPAMATTEFSGRTHANGRPVECPVKWCACWLMQKLGEVDRRLWKVSNWWNWGVKSSKRVGAVAIISPSHIGIVTAVYDDGVDLLSGNTGRRGARTVATGFYPDWKIRGYRTKGYALFN